MKTASLQFDFQNNQGGLPVDVMSCITAALTIMDGKIVRITIDEIKRQRSKNQNDYYWTVIVPIFQRIFLEGGDIIDKQQAHEFIVQEVWKHTKMVFLPSGYAKEIPDTSTNLDKREWEIKMEATRAFAANEGYMIPLPNEGQIWGHL